MKIGIRDDDSYRDFGKKFYDLTGGAELVFREDEVGDAYVFRIAHCGSTVICD
ncbi:imm11 family protein [Bradyrhizobium sp. CCGUVB1N3]|uniref:imm11 family protein n=1 Tax=Bradyrhizobium sp. CCGUVB1N3 TaxID=2949629 RepID=UPI0035319837